MSRGPSEKLSYLTTDGWPGLATPAIAAGAVHSTAPWYFAIPAIVLAVAVAIWRRRGGGGPSRPGPPGGS
ncbi:MAG: hypothetical protein ACRDOA_09430 [Streptosporangiaceae bacterium]